MAIAAPPSSLSISAGSREAPAFFSTTVLSSTPEMLKGMSRESAALTEEFDAKRFISLKDFEGISLLDAPIEGLSTNELGRQRELKVARITMQTLGNIISEIHVVGWRGNIEQSKRDVKVHLKPGGPIKEFEEEVKSSNVGRRDFRQGFRDNVPEAERYTLEGRNKWMWGQGIMLLNGAESDEEIATSINAQLQQIIELAPKQTKGSEPVLVFAA